MGFIGKVVRTIGRAGRSERRASDSGHGQEGYACAACHATFEVQHKQCPSCGSKLVVATDDIQRESDERVPW